MSIVTQLEERENNIKVKEEVLGKGIFMPNNASVAGSRRILQGTQIEQVFPLFNGETPMLQTGYENQAGEYSSTYVEAECDMTVLNKISKYRFNGLEDANYVLIVARQDGIYDVIDKVLYQNKTESFGCIYNNTYLDTISNTTGIIREGDVIKKSISTDMYENRCDGINLITAYVGSEYTKEDSIFISESAAKKLTSPLISNISIQINDNDIPLNLYGDDNVYKIMPDIKEEIKEGVICGLRREHSDHMLYSQTYSRLKTILMSDDVYLGDGEIIDIDVYTNNTELLERQHYQQLKYYHDERIRYYREIYEAIKKIKEEDRHAILSSALSKLYVYAKRVVNNAGYVNKSKEFSNIVLDITVLKVSELTEGDKITNRYGGKGCISKIVPDEQMPLLDNGKRVEVLYTPPSIVNRCVIAAMTEQSINTYSARILEYIIDERKKATDLIKWADSMLELYIEYVSMVSEKQASLLYLINGSLEPNEKVEFMDSLIEYGDIIISIDPISENKTIFDLKAIMDRFSDIIKPYNVLVPVKNSSGAYRMVNSRRQLWCGKLYIWRLKQYSKDKLSAVSLSSTNINGENSKSNSKKLNKTLYSRTCIQFGNMETGNLMHMSPEIVVANLMINSLSPKARRNFMDLLEGDIFDVDIKLKPDDSNRAVEIVNTKFKTIGLKLVFSRVKIKKHSLFVERPSLFEKCSLYEPISEMKYSLFEPMTDEKYTLFERPSLFEPLDDTKYSLFEEDED